MGWVSLLAEQPKCQTTKDKQIASFLFFLLTRGCLFCLKLFEYEFLGLRHCCLGVAEDWEILQAADESRKG